MEISNKILATNYARYLKIVLSIFMLGSMFVTQAMSQSNAVNSVVTNICSVLTTVQTVIFIIGLALMILGGALYAASHVMPGQSKGTIQGYGMGMVLGGVIGVIIAVVMPYIFSLITGSTGANAIATC